MVYNVGGKNYAINIIMYVIHIKNKYSFKVKELVTLNTMQ